MCLPVPARACPQSLLYRESKELVHTNYYLFPKRSLVITKMVELYTTTDGLGSKLGDAGGISLRMVRPAASAARILLA
jgi:hypothetical protein